MITDHVIQWFMGLLTLFVNLLPTEGTPFVQDYLSQITTDVGGLTAIANSPINAVVDVGVLTAVMAICMTIIFAIFGAKVILFVWHQVKW